MIKSVSMSNFGPIKDLSVDNFSNINLVIGPNRSGKTILLKAVYSALKTVEMFRRGRNIRSDKEILFDKLRWTFQPEKIGNLVRRPDCGNLSFVMTESEGGEFGYSFSSSAEKQIVKVTNTCEPRDTNSIFLPAKEVLSLLDTIVYEREVRQEFGFDDTYYDLAKSLTPTSKGKNIKAFSDMRGQLEHAINGRLTFLKEENKWVFRQNDGVQVDVALASEGTKKIAIFDTLLGNHYLSKNSTVFIDEPEAGLHPSLVVQLIDIIGQLAKQCGMQFFIASHSYFVIKKLYLLAQIENLPIPVISFEHDSCRLGDLRVELPDNPIIDESIKLFREEMSL